jgi:hypothetical protein
MGKNAVTPCNSIFFIRKQAKRERQSFYRSGGNKPASNALIKA